MKVESENMRWPYMVSSWTTPIRQLLLVTDSQERRLGWRDRAVQPRCLPKLELHRARRLAWRKEACVGSTFELSCFPRCVAPGQINCAVQADAFRRLSQRAAGRASS